MSRRWRTVERLLSFLMLVALAAMFWAWAWWPR
jgi:hypothetical protein